VNWLGVVAIAFLLCGVSSVLWGVYVLEPDFALLGLVFIVVAVIATIVAFTAHVLGIP
jgi:hypothetical protein